MMTPARRGMNYVKKQRLSQRQRELLESAIREANEGIAAIECVLIDDAIDEKQRNRKVT